MEQKFLCKDCNNIQVESGLYGSLMWFCRSIKNKGGTISTAGGWTLYPDAVADCSNFESNKERM